MILLHRKLNYVLFSIFAAVFFLASIVNTEEIFTINTADKPPYSTTDNNGIYDKIITHVFANMAKNIKINHLLSARSIENVQVGIDDAEYARIKGLSKTHSNLIIVDEKLLDFAFTAFSKDASIKIKGWESLEAYDVAFMRGWKIYEKNVKAKSVLIVSTENELFQVLQRGRVEIMLYELLRGVDYMKKNSISGIVDLKSPISKRGMYLYVNKRHKNIVPEIETSLRKFKKSQDYINIIKEAMNVE